MVTREEVKAFLDHTKTKMRILPDPVTFANREKNISALVELDIRPSERLEYLKKLRVEDYHSGPNPDKEIPGGPPYYEFGIMVKGREVYVKLTQGLPNKRINCISFHIAEGPITYPFRG